MKKIRPWIEPQFSQIYHDPEIPLLGIRRLPIIIGLTGPTKCGKTIMAERLVTKFGFQYSSLTNIVAELARKQGVEDLTWIDLNGIGKEYRLLKGVDILARLLISQIRKDMIANNKVVIDGLLHPAEIRFLQSFPNFSLIGVIASTNARAKAASTWYGGTLKTHLRAIAFRDSEEQYQHDHGDISGVNIGACIKIAREDGKLITVKGPLSKSTIFDKIDEKTENILGKILMPSKLSPKGR